MEKESLELKVDGITLKGYAYWPQLECKTSNKKTPLLVLCHGIPAGRPSTPLPGLVEDGGYPALARLCTWAGLPVCHFNFRGTGESGGNFDLWGWKRDLIAFLNYWEQDGRAKGRGFYLWGFSAGAAISSCVAAEDDRVKGVVLAACPARFNNHFTEDGLEKNLSWFRQIGIIRDIDFPLDPELWLRNIHSIYPLEQVARISPKPLLLVHGLEDELIHFTEAYQMYAAAKDPKRMLLRPGAAHQLRHDARTNQLCLQWLASI